MICQSKVGVTLCDRSQDIYVIFWQEWQEYREHLYRCCVKWMNGNYTNAEEALSRVMIKAWDKVKDGKYVVTNFKAWFTRLTRNLCVDIHRESNRVLRRVESIEAMAEEEGEQIASPDENPMLTATRQELDVLAKNAIEKLRTRLREVFVLYFYEEQSYREIAEQLGISYDNVRKRIAEARAILKQELREYVQDEEIADSPASKRGKSQETIPQPPQEKEVLASVGELEEVSLVAVEISADPKLFVPQIETEIPVKSEEETGENRGEYETGNQGDLPLTDQEAREEYISTEMSNMGWICAVCQGERKKAIIALESAANLESDQMAYWQVLIQLPMGRNHGVRALGAFDAIEMISSAVPQASPLNCSGFFYFPPWLSGFNCCKNLPNM